MKKGDKVKLTSLGISQGLEGPRNRKTGVVVGVHPMGYVKVLRDGTKTPYRYHQDFWELQ